MFLILIELNRLKTCTWYQSTVFSFLVQIIFTVVHLVLFFSYLLSVLRTLLKSLISDLFHKMAIDLREIICGCRDRNKKEEDISVYIIFHSVNFSELNRRYIFMLKYSEITIIIISFLEVFSSGLPCVVITF